VRTRRHAAVEIENLVYKKGVDYMVELDPIKNELTNMASNLKELGDSL
jgi:hypothetical protein